MQATELGTWQRTPSFLGCGSLGALAQLLDGEGRARAAQLLVEHGGIHGLARRLRRPLDGVREAERRRVLAGLDLGLSWATSPATAERLDRPAKVAAHCGGLVRLDTEALTVVALDAGRRPLGQHVIGGGLSRVQASPADVLRPALALGAASFVLAHNHPSGDPEPSDADVRFTHDIERAAAVCGLPLVDHVVVARGGWRSLRAGGWMGAAHA